MPTWCPFPLISMAVTLSICALARLILGVTVHPVEREASKLKEGEELHAEKEQLNSFAVLSVSGHLLAQAVVWLSLCELPIAFNYGEAAHCIAVAVIVQFEMISTRFLARLAAAALPEGSPFAEIARAPWRCFLLWPNLAAWCKSHGAVSFFYYVWSVMWYESYVNMMLAGPLERCGWPLAISSATVGVTTGLFNHGIVNGLANGIKATVFYLTMAVIFSVSHSVVPVTVAHCILYFRNLHASATSVAFSHPLFLVIMLANTGGMFLLLGALSLVLPPAIPLHSTQFSAAVQILSVPGLFAFISFLGDCFRFILILVRYVRRADAETDAGCALLDSDSK